MKKTVFLILVIAMLIVMFAACGAPVVEGPKDSPSAAPAESSAPASSAPASEAPAEEPKGEQHLYSVVTCLSGLDYFIDYKRAMEAAEKDFGVKCEFTGPTDYDMNGLTAAIDQALAKKPAGLIMLGWEDSMIPQIKKAEEQGTRVILTSQDLPESGRSLFIGSSSYELGRIAGEQMAKLLDYKGEVAVLRAVQAVSLADRFYGFRDTIAKYPDMKLVAEADNRNDETVALQAAATILQKFPNLKGFLASDGVSGPAVATSVREAGKAGEVKVITFDRDNTILQAIEEGLVSCTLVSGTPLEVYSAIQMVEMSLNSDLSVSYDDAAAGVRLFPAYIDPGVTIVTKDSVQYFKRDYKK